MNNKYHGLIAIFAIFFIAISPTNAQAFGRQKAPDSFADIVEPLTPMVVNIRTTQEVSGRDLAELYGFPPGFPMEEFLEKFGNGLKRPPENKDKDKDKKQKATSLGSGFIIQSDGVIVTNNHVIQGATEIIVVLADEREYPAEVIGSDDRTDLALLKIKAQNLPFAQFGDSNKIRVGDWVIAIGNPLGLGGTVTAGIVSARGRDIQNGPYDDFIQTDASINRGNSGGPLFNTDGKVIGINTAIFSQTGGSIGIGFAIPSAQAKEVIEQIKKFGTTKRGWLGVAIQEVNEEIAQSLGLTGAPRGALVSGVQKNSPAETANFKEGDIILEFDGVVIKNSRQLPRIVASREISKKVPVKIFRSGKELTLDVILGELEKASFAEKTPDKKIPKAPASKNGVEIPQLGITLAPISDDARKALKLADDVKGAVIVKTDSKSIANERGIGNGAIIIGINQEKIISPEDAKNKIEAAIKNGRRAILLMILDETAQTRFITLPIK